MNREYQCIGENVFIKDDINNKIYKSNKKIEEILIEENIIETLENEKRNNNYLLKNYNNIKKILTKLMILSAFLILVPIIIGYINTLNYTLILPLLSIIPVEITLQVVKKNYKTKIKKLLFSNIALSKMINKSKKKLKCLNNKKNDAILNTKLKKVDDKERIKESLLEVKAYYIYNQNKNLYIELFNDGTLNNEITDEQIYTRIVNFIEEDLKIKTKIKK